MSYIWDFLICIKKKNPPACFAQSVVYKVSRSAMFTSNYELTDSPSFYCLSILEFDSLIRLGNWFNCLLLLMHIRLKI